ncbi:MAG: carboxylating nicotinate-nucleotide diphosphorylase [Thermodesulfobacteriota bacterium]
MTKPEKAVSRARAKAPSGFMDYMDRLVDAALSEDAGTGDITTGSIVGPADRGRAEMVARESFVLAGLFVAEKVFKHIDRKVVFKSDFSDGDLIRKGSVIATVSGRLSTLLTGERVALNFLQRLSGIATLTAEFVKKTGKTGARILDTRKTTPCLRPLERYAVRVGGGENHRFGLFDRLLIKDNHIKVAGGVTEAVRRAKDNTSGSTPIEVEVTNQRELKEALAAGADIIMLDNMSLDRIKKAVRLIGGAAFTEVSGGVSLQSVGAIARTGVDFISVGALTHSARAVDISMKVVSYGNKRGR